MLVRLALWVAVTSSPAEAPSGVHIEWDAPQGCPDRSSVVAEVESLLDASLVQVHAEGVRAVAVVRASADGWTMNVELQASEAGRVRTLHAQRCRTLADAFALEVALAVDPFALVDAGDAASAETAGGQPPDAPEAPAPEAARDTRDAAQRPTPAVGTGPERVRREARVRGAIRPGAGIGFGPLPGVNPGVSVAVGVLLAHVRLELTGDYWVPRPARYAALPDVGGDVQLGAAAVRGCPIARLKLVELPVCVGFELGAMRAVGVGVPDPQIVHRLWAAVQVGPAVAWPATRWLALWVEADAVIPLVRPGFGIRDLGPVYRAPRGAARLWAGIEFRLG